jgi:hypothetical protein
MHRAVAEDEHRRVLSGMGHFKVLGQRVTGPKISALVDFRHLQLAGGVAT